MVKKLLLPVFIALSINSIALAAGESYIPQNDMHHFNQVTFTSDATLLTFSGKTGNISGNAAVDTENLDKSNGEIKIDLSTVDTGIEKRNNHMKELLEVSKYSYAVFKLTEIKGSKNFLSPNKSTKVQATGDLTIHGVTKPLTTLLTLKYLPEQDKMFRQGDWISLKANFDIKMTDFGINPPSMLAMKVSNEINIDVDVLAMKK